MYGKTWTTKENQVIEISKLSESHLLNIATFLQNRYDDKQGHEYLIKLYDIVEEIENRDLDDEWLGYILIHVKQLLVKHHIPIPLRPAQIQNNMKANEIRKNLHKSIRTITKEEEEKLWQEVESQMLPEGDRDKIVREDLFVKVNKITRRMESGTFDSSEIHLPWFVRDRSHNLGGDYKKVRVTIEVLED